MLSDGGLLEQTDFHHKLKPSEQNFLDNDETKYLKVVFFFGDEDFNLIFSNHMPKVNLITRRRINMTACQGLVMSLKTPSESLQLGLMYYT